MDNIKKLLSEAALHEQLAEEAAELAQAALKYARILRGENPTPKTHTEAYIALIEEFTDVVQCSRILGLDVDEAQIKNKTVRWTNRLNASQ